jgi:hypothetical protein
MSDSTSIGVVLYNRKWDAKGSSLEKNRKSWRIDLGLEGFEFCSEAVFMLLWRKTGNLGELICSWKALNSAQTMISRLLWRKTGNLGELICARRAMITLKNTLTLNVCQ